MRIFAKQSKYLLIHSVYPCVVFSTRTTIGSSDEIQIYHDSAWLSAADTDLESMSRLGLVYAATPPLVHDEDANNADSFVSDKRPHPQPGCFARE